MDDMVRELYRPPQRGTKISPDRHRANDDATLFVNQLEWTARWDAKFVHVAAGLYNFRAPVVHSLRRRGQPRSNPNVGPSIINQNGTPASGPGSQNFNPVFAHAELTYALESFPLFDGEFPHLDNAEYATIPPPVRTLLRCGSQIQWRGNQAYNLGFQLGSAKTRETGSSPPITTHRIRLALAWPQRR